MRRLDIINYFQQLSTTFNNFLKMTTLYIGFARMACDKSLVKKTFDAVLGEDIESIVEKTKTDMYFGKHKTYLITFTKNTPALQKIINRINCEKFIKIAYDQRWSRKDHKHIDLYWKVFIYKPKIAFIPHIIEADYGGWGPQSDDEMPELEEYLPMPPNCFGQNHRRPDFIGTSGRVWLGCSCRPGEYNPLCGNPNPATAVQTDNGGDSESSDEDCPGYNAVKPPPLTRSNTVDDPNEEIVWKTFVEKSILDEDAEWKELKESLELFGAAEVYPEMSQSELQAVCTEFSVTMPASGGQRIRNTIPQPPKLVRSDDTQAFFDA